MKPIFAVALIMLLAGCATTSDAIDAGNGTYLVYGSAGSLRGGAAAASNAAFKSANTFCAKKSNDLHAIVITSQNRTVHSLVGDTSTDELFTGGNADLHFRCAR
jgi:hypothetical protein